MTRPLLLLLGAVAGVLAASASADTRSDWETLRDRIRPVSLRVEAARSLLRQARTRNECARTTAEMIEFALKATTPHTLRDVLAPEIAACEVDATVRLVARRLGQGQALERRFLLSVARGFGPGEIDKAVAAKGLADDDADNRRLALDVLVDHRAAAAVPELESMLKAGKHPELVQPIVAGATAILKDTPGWAAWEARLVELARGPADEARRAALAELSARRDPAHFELFVASLSHPDWSTRFLSLGHLERAMTKPGLSAIVAQMEREPPGTRMNAECEAALQRLSGGMNLGDRGEDWAAWWRNNEAAFTFPTAPASGTRERLPQRSDTTVRPRFYGIEVQSQRVCFVVDISGSMRDATEQDGSGATTRIDVARRELDAIIGALPPGSLFNIIAFEARVEAWLDGIGDLPGAGDARNRGRAAGGGSRDGRAAEAGTSPAQEAKATEEQRKRDEALRAKARAWIARLEADGGTNIHDALELAFEDPLVDTIFFLTDGEPSVGKRIDPGEIRRAVQRWNATRRVRIHTIAIGAEFPLVKELAQDSGGQYRHVP